jgi:hypothetical protein
MRPHPNDGWMVSPDSSGSWRGSDYNRTVGAAREL